MAANPLNELKRKLQDENTHLSKRLCLARNIVTTHHFPTLPKEKVVADWLHIIVTERKLNHDEFRKLLTWVTDVDELTNEFKSVLIQIMSKYLQTNPLEASDIPIILSFIESDKISSQLTLRGAEYITITRELLTSVKETKIDANLMIIQRIFNGLIMQYKNSKKKLEYILKILEGENLETIFEFLDYPQCRQTVINVCQTLLFPTTKKSFFALFLKTLLQKENIDKLIEEKGDNIQSVLKIMSAFFTFPSGRTSKDHLFLQKFIQVFVTSFRSESQLIFAFYIMVGNSLNFDQSYLSPTMKMPLIIFEENNEKIKRTVFLNMLQSLIDNEIDVNVRLTDTLGGSTSKVEIKKNFTLFLQSVMMGLLKLEGKPDKITLQIIKAALILDPTLIEQKLDSILPPLMAAKKGSSLLESYIDMINLLLEIMFKIGRGTLFMHQILPHLKLILEAGNTEQFDLQQKVNEKGGIDCDKTKSKIITGNDLLPQECVDLYGKFTSELMFRQNNELLILLQKDFEENCIMMLEEGFVSPSIITISEVLSAILSSFFRKSKMADHTVPLPVAEDFWATFGAFDRDLLKRFGECILKLNFNPRLARAFLQLCQSYGELKLLNIQYSNVKVVTSVLNTAAEVSDLTVLFTCLRCEQWAKLCALVEDHEGKLALYNLFLLKVMATQILWPGNTDDVSNETKSHLIKELSCETENLDNNSYFSRALFANLDSQQMKHLSKILVKKVLKNSDTNILNDEAISTNRNLLNALALETLKNTTKLVKKTLPLSKAIGKNDFSITDFAKDIKLSDYFDNQGAIEMNNEMTICLEMINKLKIYYLEENTQLTAIFVLLTIKNVSGSKKMRKQIDFLLQSIFELSQKCPDLYKLFPIEYVFDFENKSFLELVTLKIKTSNQLLIIKCLLETAVKKVKTNSEIIKIIVKILLDNQKVKKEEVSNVEYFSDKVFQISCLILPIITKEKRAITTGAYRSILADLQEKLHKSLLKSFKSINFENEKSFLATQAGNIEDDVVASENTMATLNAMEAFSLTLSKYCETTVAEEIQSLDCLWNGFEFFVKSAVNALKLADTKKQHVESSIQLLNVVLRHIKKLESHPIFIKKDQLFLEIWQSLKTRLTMIFGGKIIKGSKFISDTCLDEVSTTLKFLSELVSQDCFHQSFVYDLFSLMIVKKTDKTKKKTNDDNTETILINHQVSKFLWLSCLKANIVGPKCIAMSKSMYRNCKQLSTWLRQHYEHNEIGRNNSEVGRNNIEIVRNYAEDDVHTVSIVTVDSGVCEVLKIDLDVLYEVILNAKKIPVLDYKFMDAIFELQHMIHFIMGSSTLRVKCEIDWQSYFKLFEGSVAVLNGLILSRNELLEDRWPCYLQCYRTLVSSLCDKASTQNELDKFTEDKLAEISLSLEKLTQLISKQKSHVSRLASYTIADICAGIERKAPNRAVRQHLENSVALLIQTTDSNYAMSFLRRGLAGNAGQITMTNLYTMYKRYHKYVGNA